MDTQASRSEQIVVVQNVAPYVLRELKHVTTPEYRGNGPCLLRKREVDYRTTCGETAC